MEPGQYLDGNAEIRDGSCYRRGALESWKAESFEGGFGREPDAWQCNDWREGEHGSIECSGGEMEPGQYLDGNAERRDGSSFRRGTLESWKAEGFGDGCAREVYAWQWNDWRAGEHGHIE